MIVLRILYAGQQGDTKNRLLDTVGEAEVGII